MSIFNLIKEELSPEERAVRDRFVDEFLFDHDAKNACIRVGFDESSALQWMRTFMTDTYVLNQIKKRYHDKNLTSEEECEKDKLLVISALRRTIMTGTGANVVNASKQLAELRGFTSDNEVDPAERLIEAFKKLASVVQ